MTAIGDAKAAQASAQSEPQADALRGDLFTTIPAPLDDNQVVQNVRLPFADTETRQFKIGLFVAIASVISAFATYLILTGLTPLSPRGGVVLPVLVINIVLILAMLVIITQQAIASYRAWQNKVAGSRLHIRIVVLFSIIATLPALLLAIAATTTFVRAIDGWFGERTRAIIETSLSVANAYVEEHGQVIRTDAVNMGRDLDDAAELRGKEPERFRELVFVQAGLRDLPAAYVIDATGKSLITAIENKNLPYRPPPVAVIKLAEQGQVPLLMPRDAYRVAAIVKLQKHPGQYLFVARGVSPTVINQLRRTEANVAEYTALRKRRSGLQIAHGLLYFMISLTGLLVAIWAGLWFAGKFVAPIGRLIAAAQHVSRGNLQVRLPERRGEGDLRRLSQTFNTMTSELTTQRNELVTTNEQLAERRRFTEAVLAGVTAGVIGLDEGRTIRLVNKSAADMLGRTTDDLVGQPFDDALPEFARRIFGTTTSTSAGTGRQSASEPLTLLVDGEERIFDVRLTREAAGGDQGAVVTVDDITELVTAQRASAWADVARRIAHEIKNPLTPIQLSAERIKRKYGKVLTEDREVFDKCTDTIIRHVGDVSRMVDEFSSFARMPKPQIEMTDLRAPVREAVTLFQMGSHDVDVDLEMPDEKIVMALDPRLIGRVMTNLVKNGAESTETKAASDTSPPDYKRRVRVTVSQADGRATIDVIDNGTGLDKSKRSKLLEPYVTTKAKGTGLGLAIVQKIIEQHGGTIALEDIAPSNSSETGARVRVRLPVRDLEAATAAVETVAAE